MFIVVLCIAMFIGAFVFGEIPVIFSMTPKEMRALTTLGSGMLVGTALIIIIPEGVETLYNTAVTSTTGNSTSIHELQHRTEEMTGQIGPAIALGFVFMLLVDRIFQMQHSHSHSHGSAHKRQESAANQSGTEGFRVMESKNTEKDTRSHIAATIGLIVHAAVDGVAVGAVSFSDSGGTLEIVVFFAIMLHKAPAAFGISMYLLHAGKTKDEITARIILFSAAAPVMALVTFLFLSQAPVGQQEMMVWVGLALLFSAGTFLYVATVHVLPEITTKDGVLEWPYVATLVLGVLFPMIIHVDEAHAT